MDQNEPGAIYLVEQLCSPEDLARDDVADLAMCDEAPEGPWERVDCMTDGQSRYVAPPGWNGMPVLYSYCPPHTALTFACMAREALPAWIRRYRLEKRRREQAERERAILEQQYRNACDQLQANSYHIARLELDKMELLNGEELRKAWKSENDLQQEVLKLQYENEKLKEKLSQARQDIKYYLSAFFEDEEESGE